ncbi:MAG TPA: family 10 glycosylhydrolase [Chthoniobacteraceae bacterium]|jgi:uncharacterized lipoprotein YddW (UPF0748 family)|nr:family 10 glycosylhydrolase [Chthoniobacteraceae bacterium]
MEIAFGRLLGSLARTTGVLCGLLALPALAADVPDLPREFRGAWVASVYNLNWPSKPGLPTAQQQAELRAILDRAASVHLNAVLLQVRPASDALYESKLEPWSTYLTGAMGRAPEPRWDPLAWAITEAHARGLELHAWFNPFRAANDSSGAPAPNHIARTHPAWIRRFGTTSYIDPGIPAAREYVRGVIMDVVKRYDVDGIHIDDYFYPYPVKGRASGFPDGDTFQQFQANGGKLGLADWRRDNTNQFVESLYRSIKTEKRWVKFGISPFGIWRPQVPETIVAGVDSYDQLYADSRRWLREGWCDYMAPQLYWPIDPPAQSFPVLLNWWREQNVTGRGLWPGLATERIGAKLPASEIARQVALTREQPAGGQIHWDMKSLMSDQGGIVALLRDKTYRAGAAVPAAPWLGKETPLAPKLERQGRTLKWHETGAAPARWWAVQSKVKGEWMLRMLPAGTTSFTAAADAETVAVRAVDRFGNASAPAVEKW